MTIWEKDYETIRIEKDGSWVTIWLNRPESKNALSETMTSELLEVLEAIASYKLLRGLALRGVNKCFCAGADLKDFKRNFISNTTPRKQIVKMSVQLGQLFKRIYTMPQLVVALVEGPAFAGGFGLACCSDFVLGTRNTKFSLSETKIGLTPAQIAPYIIERIGKRLTKTLMLSGTPFNGSQAYNYGVIDQLADDESELETQFSELKLKLAACAPEATAITKEIIISHNQMESPETINSLANRFADCMTSPEAKEGLQAFIEKRKPNWTEL